ncbi:MAG: NAD(P)/FAD-dependent oxidoreductase [Ruminococcus sp.]|nr:NAD(P)/FAD-dependent oxidoreductase [Ruminococcus sp.]
MHTSDVLIIGGGASGLFASVQLAWQGKDVTVIEHMSILGKKLLITGKGRCNVTNNSDTENVMANIPRNPRFLYSALSRFTPEDTMAFFESLGVELKTERGNRVFPTSDKASSIVGALVNAARDAGVNFITDNALELIIQDRAVKGVKCEKGSYYAEKIIVATGGKSYPKTGSTGDGYVFAEQAGHTVTDLTPSLCPVVTVEKEPVEMMGLSLRNCTLSLYEQGREKPIFSELGEMLFTHFGLSGPLVLSASAHMDKIEKGRYVIAIDLKPALSHEKLDERILRDFGDFPNRDFSNSLNKLLPSKMIPIIVKMSGILPFKKVNQITREERERLVSLLKDLRFTVKGLRPIDEAIITRGGVNVNEISPKTMESKLMSGLYFIGEVLDVDAYTGGYNLQIAFATANAAALAMM